LSRQITDSSTRNRRVFFAAAARSLFVDGHFKNVLQTLRRHREMPSDRIDVRETIRATVAAAGRFQFRTGTRSRSPDYLLLVDRVSTGDHVAALGDVLLDRLISEQVSVVRYDFYGDPRRARRQNDGVPLSTSAI
jgi:hypothetical protein